MRSVLMEFLREFANCTTYWYVPKARALTDTNVHEMALMLQIVQDEFGDRAWDAAAQKDLLRRLVEEGLLSPTSAGGSQQDRNALVRILKVLLEELGLAWVDESEAISVTTAGSLLAATSEAADREKQVKAQILKLQYPPYPKNDSWSHIDTDGLIPHVFLLQVLQKTRYRLSYTEWTLFLNLAQRHTDLDRIVRFVLTWRDLTDDERAVVLAKARTVAMPLTTDNRWTRINNDRPYQVALYTYVPYLSIVDDEVRAANTKELNSSLAQLLAEFKVSRFESKFEWISYLGDPEQQPNWTTYLLSALDNADSAKEAQDVIRKGAAAGAKAASSEEVQARQIEKQIEDFYVENLDLIERGLYLVEGGRQFSTPIGKLDLLCVDANDKWVVVEFKAGEAKDDVFGQVLRYMGYIHRHFDDGAQNVRSIIVASSFSDKARYSRIGLMRDDDKQVIAFKKHGLTLSEVG